MKVLVCDPISDQALGMLKAQEDFEVDVKTGMTPDELAQVIEPYHAVIVRSATKVRKPAIDAAKNLKVIARGGVGLDNIDVAEAKAKGIEVVNTPGASSLSVAEMTIGMMLMVSRKLNVADSTMKENKWEKKKLKGFEISNKTLGIIGLGQIGKNVARLAQGFDMKVLVYDPYLSEDDVKKLGAEFSTLGNLLGESDYITIHVPLTDETKGIINADTIAKMKDGVVVINCARGGVVDEAALLEGLKSGKVRGAGVDVFESEPAVDNALVKQPNVVASPHIGASTKEGQDRVGIEVAEKIIKILKG